MPSFLPEFGVLKVGRKKLDDFVSSTFGTGSRSLFLSQKTFNIIKEYNIAPYVSKKIEYVFRKKIYDYYYYLMLYSHFVDIIDFSKSIFYSRKFFGNEIYDDHIVFSSFEEYDKKIREPYESGPKLKILPRLLYFENRSLLDLDFFGIYYIQ